MNKKQIDQEKDEAGKNGAAGHMNDALLKKSNEIRDLVGDAEKNDVLARYNIAREIREVRDAAKYGANAMKKLADFLGWSETTTGDYAALAATWSDAEKFATLATKAGKNGIPLSWSHFLELRLEKDGNRRRSLMKRALDEGWTVAKLEQERKSVPPESSDDDTTENPMAETESEDGAKRPITTTNPVKAVVNGMTEKLVAVKAACDTDLPKTVASVPADRLDDVMVSLQQGREQFAALYRTTMESYDLSIEQVEARRKLVAKKQAKPADNKQAVPVSSGAAKERTRRSKGPAMTLGEEL